MFDPRFQGGLQQPRYIRICATTSWLALLLLCNSLTTPVFSAESTEHFDFPKQVSKGKASVFSQSSSGGNATLTYKPAPCLISSPAGSDISPRTHQLLCSVLRSASRAEYLSGEVSSNHIGLDTSNVFEPAANDSSVSSDRKLANRSIESEVSYQGQYLMSLEIGTPARAFTGIIDTGSDLTWIQCRPCILCYEQTHRIFRPRESSTYKHVSCKDKPCDYLPVSRCSPLNDHCVYRYRYGDSSFTYGRLSSDTFTLNSTSGLELKFPGVLYGCSHASDGIFTRTGADGLIALGQGHLSLASQIGGFLGSNIFSYCLVSQNSVSDSVTSPFYFGDAAVPSNSTGLSYTRIITNQRNPVLYYVDFTGISVGNRRLKLASDVFALSKTGQGGTIIDSGTTVSNLKKTAFDALQRALVSSVPYNTTHSDSGFGLCFDVRGHKHKSHKFPSLTFHLQGVDLSLPRDNYIVEAEDDTLCLAIHRSRTHSLSIIGNIQQQNYQVVYDNDNKRIGFMPTVCG